MAIAQESKHKAATCMSVIATARAHERNKAVKELYNMALRCLRHASSKNNNTAFRKACAEAYNYIDTALHIHRCTSDGPHISTRICSELKPLCGKQNTEPGSKRMFMQVQNKRPFRKLSIEST